MICTIGAQSCLCTRFTNDVHLNVHGTDTQQNRNRISCGTRFESSFCRNLPNWDSKTPRFALYQRATRTFVQNAQSCRSKEVKMLDITADKVAEVIILARELDRAEAEFDAFIERLNVEEQACLVAIFWIGRGTYEPE